MLVLTALVAWDHLTAGRGLYRVDILTQYLPWYTHLGQYLRHGDIPGWIPNYLSGTPFAGDPQSGWLYLPVMAIFPFFSGVTGFDILIVFHLLLAGLATYALARVLGLVPIGAVAAATAYEFGNFLERIRCCTIHAEVGAWLPLALLGVELAVRARSWFARAGWWAVAGLALSQMIAGWIGQGAYYGLLATCGYILYRTLIAPPCPAEAVQPASGEDTEDSPAVLGEIAIRRVARAAMHLIAVVAIALGLAAGALWPRFQTVAETNLAGGDYSQVSAEAADTGGWSVHKLAHNLLDQNERLGRWYLGGAICALAIVAPFVARRRFAVHFFAGLSLVTMILTLHEGPLHRLFYLLPRFRQLHQHLPDHILIVFYLGPALLTGATVTAFWEAPARRRGTLLALAPIALIAGLDLWLASTYPHIPAATLAGLAAACLLLLAVVWLRPHRLRLAATVALVIVGFLDPTGRLVLARIDGDPNDAVWSATVTGYTEASGAGVFLQEQQARSAEPFRFFGYDPLILSTPPVGRRTYVTEYASPEITALLLNNQSILLGLQDAQGYNPVQLSIYSAFLNAVNQHSQGYHYANILPRGWSSPLLKLLNVRYIVVPAVIPPGRPDLLHLSQRYRTVYADRQVRVLLVDDALPRAWIVHDLRNVAPTTIFSSLRAGDVDPRRTALLSTNPPETGQPKDPSRDRAAIAAYEPDRIDVTTSSGAAGLLVLSEIDQANWHAYVDGKPGRVYQTDGILRGVPIPAGDHTVELRYDQPSLRFGLLVSAATALVVCLAVLALGLQRRRSRWQSGKAAIG